jgi:hypothetical protein
MLIPLFVLLCVTFPLNGMEHGLSKLVKSYSTWPAADQLKKAVLSKEVEIVSMLLPDHLPGLLEHQYALFCLDTSPEIRSLLLQNIFKYWKDRIAHDPQDGILVLAAQTRTLCALFRQPQQLDVYFLKTLSQIRADALALETVQNSKKLSAQAEALLTCEYQNLKEQLAREMASIGAIIPALELLPADLIELIDSLRCQRIRMPSLTS